MSENCAQDEDSFIFTHPEDQDNQTIPLVEIKEVKKSFGEKIALKDVSFSVPSGQICGLLLPLHVWEKPWK